MPQGLERGRENGPVQIEDGVKRAHDGGGSRDDDAGNDSHFAIGLAFADGVGARPDFDDAPDESEHEKDSKRRAESLPERGEIAAGSLSQ